MERRRWQAAIKGAGEIGFTILSISISLVAVFIPLFLMSGVVGLLFREFAVTVAVSIAVSRRRVADADADDVRPPLDAGSGQAGARCRRRSSGSSTGWSPFTTGRWSLRCAIAGSRWLVMMFTVFATVALFVVIPKGFFPQQDTGMIVGISEGAQDISPQAMMDRQQAVLGVVDQGSGGRLGDRLYRARRIDGHRERRAHVHHAQAARARGARPPTR